MAASSSCEGRAAVATVLPSRARQLAARLAEPDADDKPLAALAARSAPRRHGNAPGPVRQRRDAAIGARAEPGALEENRTPGDDAAPWLSFQAMIFGSDDLLGGYPQPELKAVRRAWAEVKAAYLWSRARPIGRRSSPPPMDRFAEAVRTLGEQIEPLRQKLPHPTPRPRD